MPIGFQIISVIIFILAFSIIGFVIVLLISPKLRGKWMSRQVKATKYMVDESKDDIHSITSNVADASKEGIETTVRAIKKGIVEDEDIFCKHCGAKIDSDSKFCKKCGKEQ